jgi:hypothetical protein
MDTDQGLMLLVEVFLTVTLPWNPDPQSWVIFQSTFTSLVAAWAVFESPATDNAVAARAAMAIVGRVYFMWVISSSNCLCSPGACG